jgi:hypothetical protein
MATGCSTASPTWPRRALEQRSAKYAALLDRLSISLDGFALFEE